jgi:pilus assembly protein Flp/PilA
MKSFYEMNPIRRLTGKLVALKIWRDSQGQDLIEYALMAGFVAVAAGALMPGVSTSISTVFSKVASVMTGAAGS